ncbi:tRNA(Phe) (7-(3-amino-3-carboxypropyl)wyosine(37)-C(2))-hydroxylase [Theileria orientalis]|uniref:tRNA(Phe) (7-(3-amino-3-carboxypropyl)wyosine(37)-C(2))-hydroxylase n=1 Tax=Theileria orientalis TaxID=68886 RepID=A0A976MCF2_THEOR|nr:tRNA(Phe) (7-(3-amino-3-carboxypropyl)wyosine(37)-C(2))-hydroxylase [Theileria orientalis]
MKEALTVSKDADIKASIKESIPFKITGYSSPELGGCLDEWNPERLKSILKDCKISVHVSRDSNLNFVSKNFEYEYMTVLEMFERIERSQKGLDEDPEYLYYRSLGNRPRKDPATLESVHPYLGETFKLPNSLTEALEHSQVHSTVFRISQCGLELWTHYDALDNFLVQVHGHKLILLFPPSALHKLSITDTSSPYRNICKLESNNNRELLSAYDDAFRVLLNPGDILFIPSAWSHAVQSLSSKDYMNHGLSDTSSNRVHKHDEQSNVEVCVSVNVFFLDSEVKYFSKNIYGNEDPMPIKRACDILRSDFLKLSSQLPVNLQKAFWSKVAAISLDYLNKL